MKRLYIIDNWNFMDGRTVHFVETEIKPHIMEALVRAQGDSITASGHAKMSWAPEKKPMSLEDWVRPNDIVNAGVLSKLPKKFLQEVVRLHPNAGAVKVLTAHLTHKETP